MQALYERYRPATLAEVCGHPKVVARLKALASRSGLAGKAYWLSGPSGTGKTTLARLIAADVADDFGVEEVDAQWLTPARLRELELGLSTRGWGEKGGRVVIVNEAHGLSDAAIRQLLTMLERIPAHVCWVFTTTTAGQAELFAGCTDTSPLLSRCIRFDLETGWDFEDGAIRRVMEIAQREGLDGQPYDAYKALYFRCKRNFRAMLQAVEGGEMLA